MKKTSAIIAVLGAGLAYFTLINAQPARANSKLYDKALISASVGNKEVRGDISSEGEIINSSLKISLGDIITITAKAERYQADYTDREGETEKLEYEVGLEKNIEISNYSSTLNLAPRIFYSGMQETIESPPIELDEDSKGIGIGLEVHLTSILNDNNQLGFYFSPRFETGTHSSGYSKDTNYDKTRINAGLEFVSTMTPGVDLKMGVGLGREDFDKTVEGVDTSYESKIVEGIVGFVIANTLEVSVSGEHKEIERKTGNTTEEKTGANLKFRW